MRLVTSYLFSTNLYECIIIIMNLSSFSSPLPLLCLIINSLVNNVQLYYAVELQPIAIRMNNLLCSAMALYL